MGILKRVNDVVKSNVNEVLDKMTDPAKEVELLIVEMEANVKKARQEVIASAAVAKREAKRCEDLQEEIEKWQRRAESAVQTGDDDLAKEGLRRKMQAERDLEATRRIQAEQEAYVEQLKDSVAKLESRVKEIKLRKETIKQKARAAKQGTPGISKGKAFAEFDRLEDRIEAIEAAAELTESLDGRDAATEAKFARLEAESDPKIEDELAELKRRLNSK